jgi:diketogulonate reductase-like aldo/keto reductase
VSNFHAADLDAVLSLGGVRPAVNQCQMSVNSHDAAQHADTVARGVTYQVRFPSAARGDPLGDA